MLNFCKFGFKRKNRERRKQNCFTLVFTINHFLEVDLAVLKMQFIVFFKMNVHCRLYWRIVAEASFTHQFTTQEGKQYIRIKFKCERTSYAFCNSFHPKLKEISFIKNNLPVLKMQFTVFFKFDVPWRIVAEA